MEATKYNIIKIYHNIDLICQKYKKTLGKEETGLLKDILVKAEIPKEIIDKIIEILYEIGRFFPKK